MSVHSPVLSSHITQLNYKADGSPFWNQFFVAALRDSEGGVVNYVGVQCEVNTLPIEGIKDRYVSQSVSLSCHEEENKLSVCLCVCR